MTDCAASFYWAFGLGAWAVVVVLGVSIAVGWMVTDMRQLWQAYRARSTEEAIMAEMDLFTAADAAEAHDRALERVTDPDWTLAALAAFEKLPADFEGIGSDFRQALLNGGLKPPPRGSNAWGAFINRLAKRGLIERTGAYRAMDYEGSNARESPVWRRVAA